MSSSTSSKEWLVQVPDHPNALDKRLAARPEHLANIGPHVKSGRVVMGGATLTKHPNDDEGPDMTGSVMIIKADTEEEVRQMIENDVYTKGGAWDTQNAKIWPFKSAVRSAL